MSHNRIRLHPGQMTVWQSPARFRVVVAGRRWGKCCKAGTLIAMSDGSYKRIEDVASGDQVLTISEKTYSLESKAVKHVHDNGVKDIVRIVTRSGKRLEVTPNHPILVNNVWTEAKDVKLGDLAAIPRATVFGVDEVRSCEIDFLAIWLAEGDSSGYTNQTPEIIDVMTKACGEMGVEFVDSATGDRKAGLYWRWRGVKPRSNACIDLLKKHGLRHKNSKTKFIPDCIFRLPKSQLARFLNLFIACDGSINRRSKNTWAVEIALANEKMTEQIADLFLKFGIRGQISKKVHKAKSSVSGDNFISWRFIVSDSKSLITFCDQIGALSKESKVARAKLAASASRGSCNSYLPISHDDFIEHLSYKPVFKGKYGGYNCVVSRDLPEALRERLNGWRKQTPSRVSEYRYSFIREFGDGYFDPIADGDFAWDEISEIECVDKDQTYDLTVDGNHNFIANGLVTHNTALSKALIIRYAKMPRRKVWYVAPTYRMAKQIMWQDLQDTIPPRWVRKMNDTSMTIWLINGSVIELKGADNPDTLRGVGLDFVVLDEYQDMSEDTWHRVLRPTMADTRGHALFIGSPKSYNLLHDAYILGQDPIRVAKRQWQSWQFPTITSPFIPVEEIEQARRDMDSKSFAQEFLASFETMAGRVYYAFDRHTHVKKCEFNPNLPIWIGQDFNIDPMSSIIMQPQLDGSIWVVDEIVLFGSNTEESVDEIERRYYRYRNNVTIYPDPAGTQRQHARGETDLDIFRERGFRRIKHRAQHPRVADRVNCFNKMLRSTDGTIRLYVDPSCKGLIESLEQTIYKKGSRDIDKSISVDHATDAAGYCLEVEFSRKVKILGVSI